MVQAGEPYTFVYKNWRGEVAERQVVPEKIGWGTNEWHPEPQWLMEGFDVDRQAMRCYALGDVIEWRAGPEGCLSHLGRDETAAVEEARVEVAPEHRSLLEQLAGSALGRSLIANRGLDGYWIDYIVRYPIDPSLQRNKIDELEQFMLTRAPLALATQQRFQIFLDVLQRELKEGMRVASVPCGMMSELLMLDREVALGVEMVGIDLDPTSIVEAARRAKVAGLEDKTTFQLADAWQLSGEYDVISSSGLNLYVHDDAKVTELYRQLYGSLKPGGVLVTSAPTPPSDWEMGKIEMDALIRQKELFVDVLKPRFQALREVEMSVAQLKEAGFETVEVLYDDAHIFPTFVARR